VPPAKAQPVPGVMDQAQLSGTPVVMSVNVTVDPGVTFVALATKSVVGAVGAEQGSADPFSVVTLELVGSNQGFNLSSFGVPFDVQWYDIFPYKSGEVGVLQYELPPVSVPII